MARKKSAVPSYLLHKPTGQARVRVDGRDYYLGPYGSEESRIKFGEIVAKIGSGQSADPFVAKSPATLQAESSHNANLWGFPATLQKLKAFFMPLGGHREAVPRIALSPAGRE